MAEEEEVAVPRQAAVAVAAVPRQVAGVAEVAEEAVPPQA